VQRSPIEHPTSFIVMAVVTGLMMFDFCFFREQTCIVACPYGRMQSVMLDRDSLVITYDEKRGEPRGRLKRVKAGDDGDIHLKTIAAQQGDCIDCHMCVTTCPTGIDIRNGLQMECVGCAQCIDACDAVMDKIGKPRGLIRYSTQAAVEGEKAHILRPRPIIYAVVLSALVSLFFTVLSTKADADVTILRGPGLPFTQIETGAISNGVRFKITNRTDEDAVYTIAPVEPSSMAFIGEDGPVTIALAAGEIGERSVRLAVGREVFHDGEATGVFRVTDESGFDKIVHYKLLGPRVMHEEGHEGEAADDDN
jgi:cytochrome c oxidase accessory protein FixG